jgi:methanol--5-hydroxybenzimidazolylcobamide Co-methyltransferase
MCDFWSNESVQNIKLLSGPAVTATAEQLVYDCRIMNLAKSKGKDTALLVRNLYAESDMWLEPQAFILAPENVIKIAGEIVKEKGYYNRIKRAAEATIEEISKSAKAGKLKLNKFEQEATAKLEKDIAALPGDLATLTKDVIDDLENFDRKMYDM